MEYLGCDYPNSFSLLLNCYFLFVFLFLWKKKLPQTSCLGFHLEFLLFKAVCSQFSFVIPPGEIFLLITIQELFYVFVFLGFLTPLANFGLVAPIPIGIRVLGVETPLRT